MDIQLLNNCLQRLNSSCSTSCYRETVETLLIIHRNIFFNKDDSKYRKLMLHNPAFRRKVWDVAPAHYFMNACGWTKIDDALFFHADENLVNIINILLENRFVAPNDSEWEEATKVENLHVSEQQEKQRRNEAAKERQKELEEFKKDKMYREQLAENIKRQIKDDRKHNKKLFTKPAIANKLNKSERASRPLSRGDGHSDSDDGYYRRLTD